MIKIEINFKGPTNILKQHQLAEAAKRTLKYMAETDYSEYVAEVEANVLPDEAQQ